MSYPDPNSTSPTPTSNDNLGWFILAAFIAVIAYMFFYGPSIRPPAGPPPDSIVIPVPKVPKLPDPPKRPKCPDNRCPLGPQEHAAH